MVHLPLGLRLTPFAYAASSGRVTDFPAGSAVVLGPRSIDANPLALELSHSGTALVWRYAKPDSFTLCGAWRADTLGEWGLRFWVVLCLQAGSGEPWFYDVDSGELRSQMGHRHVIVCCQHKPLLTTFHASEQALIKELEEQGYFYLNSRAGQGVVAALRFNLEEAAGQQFVVTMADSLLLAREHAQEILAQTDIMQSQADAENTHEPLAAVRDVVGWNTVWDDINQRSYTALSRNWNRQKFGGFGVWLDDVFYHALLASVFDMQLARENLLVVLAGLTPQGNLPCLLTGNDAWVDRSQPPIGSFIVWLIYQRSSERSLLELAYPALLSNHDWWWRERDRNGDGLVEYGTSDVGSGLYIGTKLAAKDESSMDNSPVHDEAELDTQLRTLNCHDVGLNSLLVLDGEMLARIARQLGDQHTAERLFQNAQALQVRIRDNLWDSERNVFANRLWSGQFVRSLAPTSFYPLLAGAATPGQAQVLIDQYLLNPNKFGGEWWLPAVSRDDPAFNDNVYWRGRIWPPLNFLVYYGLKRYGYDEIASQLADNGYRLFSKAWQQRQCPENFNAVSGIALDQPDTDSFYTWGALLPYLAVVDADVKSNPNPWQNN